MKIVRHYTKVKLKSSIDCKIKSMLWNASCIICSVLTIVEKALYTVTQDWQISFSQNCSRAHY